jgi:hypothetical protein
MDMSANYEIESPAAQTVTEGPADVAKPAPNSTGVVDELFREKLLLIWHPADDGDNIVNARFTAKRGKKIAIVESDATMATKGIRQKSEDSQGRR